MTLIREQYELNNSILEVLDCDLFWGHIKLSTQQCKLFAVKLHAPTPGAQHAARAKKQRSLCTFIIHS